MWSVMFAVYRQSAPLWMLADIAMILPGKW